MNLGRWLVLALFAALPLSTAAQEIALGAALIVALASRRRWAFAADPWARPAIAVALGWTLGSFASGDLREGAGHAWLLAPLLAVPALRGASTDRVVTVGLGAAAIAAAWGVVQRLGGTVAHAGFSHHLSLAYALLPPLGVALARRRHAIAALLACGVLATGSEGAAVALVITALAALTRRPLVALGVGVAVTLAAFGAADPAELGQRAILWTGGLRVAEAGSVGPGAYAGASALEYDSLSPGFWFPNHAHDSAIQLLAVLGPAGLVATLWLCGAALSGASAGAAAGLAGVLVGTLTQDALGDLEVARAAWAWLALLGAGTISGREVLSEDADRPRPDGPGG